MGSSLLLFYDDLPMLLAVVHINGHCFDKGNTDQTGILLSRHDLTTLAGLFEVKS